MDRSKLKVAAHRERWDRKGQADEPVLAANLIHQGKPVDCYAEIAAEYALRLDLQPTDRVLEVGCGSGCLLLKLRDRVGEVVGTDFSANMLKHLDGTGVETHCCEADALPFPDDSFDKVCCNGVVQYFPDEDYARRAVSELLRVCRPGGRVLIGDVINGQLKADYQRSRRRVNGRGLRGVIRWVKNWLLRPIFHLFRFGAVVDTGPLFLTPFFFKYLLVGTPHRWWPLLQTVESKPPTFLSYRFDVLIEKDALAEDRRRQAA